MTTKVTDFYFVRHGSTDYNREHRIQGQCDRADTPDIVDMPLNEIGKAEAKRAAKALEDAGLYPELTLSSPLLRAQQTGKIIAEHFSIPMRTDARLCEMFFGPKWEGMVIEDFYEVTLKPPHVAINTATKEPIVMHNGLEVRRWHKSIELQYDLVSHPGGETKQEVRKRVKAALEEVGGLDKYQRICIPSHGAVMRFFMSDVAPTEAAKEIVTGAIVHFVYSPQTRMWEFQQRFNMQP